MRQLRFNIIKLFIILGIMGIKFESIIFLGVLVQIACIKEIIRLRIEGGDFMSSIRWSLIILRAWITMLIALANYNSSSKRMLLGLVEASLILLLLCFIVKRLLGFYFYFEAVLIPIFLMVLGWGYQPERLRAAFYIFFYTLTASLPLLVRIVWIMFITRSLSFHIAGYYPPCASNMLLAIIVIAFMVKFPIYFFHLWLPKAHVEAPVSGSMILAGVLLKLGGYGLFLTMIFNTVNLNINRLLSTLAIVGAAGLAILILRMRDIKVAIAYSSVVHIRIVIVVYSRNRTLGLLGGLWIIIAHGITSSGMFSAANIIYERSHRRSLFNNKGVLRKTPFFSIVWFMLIVLNFAGPFTINLFREMLIIRRMIRISWSWFILIGIVCFFSAAYNLNLFASRQQGLRVALEVKGARLNIREIITLFSHIWPAIVLLLRLILLNNNIRSMWIL